GPASRSGAPDGWRADRASGGRSTAPAAPGRDPRAAHSPVPGRPLAATGWRAGGPAARRGTADRPGEGRRGALKTVQGAARLMEVIHGLEAFPKQRVPAAVPLGTFDGLPLAHQALLALAGDRRGAVTGRAAVSPSDPLPDS